MCAKHTTLLRAILHVKGLWREAVGTFCFKYHCVSPKVETSDIVGRRLLAANSSAFTSGV
jgi:hypothetical protein